MSPRPRISVYIDPEHAAQLKALKRRDGISEAEAIRRALTMYLERRGVAGKTARKRAATRKRA